MDYLELSTFVAILTAMVAIVFIAFEFRLKRQIEEVRKTNYSMEQQRAVLDSMRNKLESDMYRLNRELTSSDERWREMYHLLLSSQRGIDRRVNKMEPTRLSQFLVDMGMTAEDMVIDKQLVFVLTPFHESHLPLFMTIVNVCQRYGLKCIRGDEGFVGGDIFPKLLKSMVKARLIIADVDGRNPNVFYELGIAHALDKPVIMVAKNVKDLPFDVQSQNIVIYDGYDDLPRKLAEALTRATLAS